MARKVERLLRVDPAGCTRDQQFDCLAEVDAVIARAQACREGFLAAIHDPSDDREWAREQVACELRWSPDYAKTRLMQATHLVEKLPRLLALHAAGQISDAHVRVAADLTCQLDPAMIAKVEERVLERAAQETVTRFRASLRRVIARLDTRKAEERYAEAKAERLVHCNPLPDGMAGLWSTHTAADGEAMYAQLTAMAKNVNDGRTMVQKRADTLRDLVLGRTAAGTPARGMRVQVLVREDTADGSSDLPGELAGYGPIPASQCREIMADPSTRIDRVLVDSTGRVIPECGIDAHPARRFPPPRSGAGSPRSIRPAASRVQPQGDQLRMRPHRALQRPQHCDRQSRTSVFAASPLQARRRLDRVARLCWDHLVDLAHWQAVRQADRRVACRRSVAGPAVAFVAKSRGNSVDFRGPRLTARPTRVAPKSHDVDSRAD